eukprot:TRINITY_DN13707_c0_g2_i2.p2 TRINITY_DN13707_c0_g2~~TRINITY_DN13707_c0_g2_i2.p2  ORF type:complete len:127 (-),score=13.44 TRINITY_DN13707_c0_g2_i2:901-1281(-)
MRYMSPEAKVGLSTYAADWWSVGVVALMMAVGDIDMPNHTEYRSGTNLIDMLTSSPESLNSRLDDRNPMVKDFIRFLTTYFLVVDPSERLPSLNESSRSFTGDFFTDTFWHAHGTWDELRSLGLDS